MSPALIAIFDNLGIDPNRPRSGFCYCCAGQVPPTMNRDVRYQDAGSDAHSDAGARTTEQSAPATIPPAVIARTLRHHHALEPALIPPGSGLIRGWEPSSPEIGMGSGAIGAFRTQVPENGDEFLSLAGLNPFK